MRQEMLFERTPEELKAENALLRDALREACALLREWSDSKSEGDTIEFLRRWDA